MSGQSTVYKILKRARKPLSSKEISQRAKMNKLSVDRYLRIMYKYGEVKRDEIAGKIYWWRK